MLHFVTEEFSRCILLRCMAAMNGLQMLHPSGCIGRRELVRGSRQRAASRGVQLLTPAHLQLPRTLAATSARRCSWHRERLRKRREERYI